MLDKAEDLVQKVIVSRRDADAFAATFGLMKRFIDLRGTPEGVLSNNLNGMAKSVKTPQEGVTLMSKTSADWMRCRHSLQNHQYAGVGFVMDGALSFLPLAHSDLFLDDAGACSSLEFALRFFTSDLDFNNWHLKELKTITGGYGRTYSEARLWDRNGNMVANMTQQSILQPLKPVKRAVL